MEIELVTFNNGALSLLKKIQVPFYPFSDCRYFDRESKKLYYVKNCYFTDKKLVAIISEVEQIEDRPGFSNILTYLDA